MEFSDTHSYLIRGQLQIIQLAQPFQILNLHDLILHKIEICQIFQMIHLLDVLDFVEAQIKTREICELIQSFQMGYGVVVKIEFQQL